MCIYELRENLISAKFQILPMMFDILIIYNYHSKCKIFEHACVGARTASAIVDIALNNLRALANDRLSGRSGSTGSVSDEGVAALEA